MAFAIYQEIYSETATELLKALESGETEIRINSAGGNIFSAITMYNLLKDKDVVIRIDGFCASAATLIACGGKCIAAANSLFLIHNPAVELWSSYTAEELLELKNSLDKIKESILNIYITKMHIGRGEVEALMDAETWLTADEALQIGLIDEIDETEVLDIMAMEGSKALMDKYKNSVIAAERSRVESLTSAKAGIPAVDALIDVAIKKGAELKDVAQYIDAVKNVASTRGLDELYKLIEDNMKSGGENVGGGGTGKVETSDLIAKYANEYITQKS